MQAKEPVTKIRQPASAGKPVLDDHRLALGRLLAVRGLGSTQVIHGRKLGAVGVAPWQQRPDYLGELSPAVGGGFASSIGRVRSRGTFGRQLLD